MAQFLERMGIFARAPDTRPLAQIAADIDDELAFHVEESARALVDAGYAPSAAHDEALRRFGNVDRIRRECARTLMGERLVLQRIQIVLTAVLVAAMGLLLWSNWETQAQAAAERSRSLQLLAQLEARLAREDVPAQAGERGSASDPRRASTVIDRKPVPLAGGAGVADHQPVPPASDPEGEYLSANGALIDLAGACSAWGAAFEEQAGSWRHGLRVAERLAALPGSQGAEILAGVWPRLSVEHREQVLKPFVFDGGHPHVLEVLQLGFDDPVGTVKERAVLYLHTYAWQDLWSGDGVGAAWFARFRDLPIADVLRENATRWAREYVGEAERLPTFARDRVEALLKAAGAVRPEAFTRAGVDLAGILAETGVCALGPERLADLPLPARALADHVRSWCAF